MSFLPVSEQTACPIEPSHTRMAGTHSNSGVGPNSTLPFPPGPPSQGSHCVLLEDLRPWFQVCGVPSSIMFHLWITCRVALQRPGLPSLSEVHLTHIRQSLRLSPSSWNWLRAALYQRTKMPATCTTSHLQVVTFKGSIERGEILIIYLI